MLNVFIAGTSGTIKELADPLTERRAESGIMTSAGLGPSDVEKKVAVNVVLKYPV
jgi:hypothetical protein